jgi:hypothetical protein
MILQRLNRWWHRLPQKTRIQLIASVLLVFAGTEVLVLAPYVLDIAAMIDVFGLAMIAAAIKSSFSVSLLQLRELAHTTARPLVAASRVADALADSGMLLLSRWDRHYLVIDRLGTKTAGAFLVLFTVAAVARTMTTWI